MRDARKVVIGFGSIWGLFAFGTSLISSFTLGTNDTAPEVVAIVVYGLTILPACILAIWSRRKAAMLLISAAFITAFGFTYQIGTHPPSDSTTSRILSECILLTLAAIPGLLGYFLLTIRDSPDRQ